MEVRFEIPVEHAVLTGPIDLLLKCDAEGNILEASVIDFKGHGGRGGSRGARETPLDGIGTSGSTLRESRKRSARGERPDGRGAPAERQ